MTDIWNSLLSSATSGSNTNPPPITPENPVNGEVWTSGKNAIPNPFFAAMNQQTVQNVQMAANGNIGGILASRGKISGSAATIINATLDYFLKGETKTTQTIPDALKNRQYTANFIPIIIKTEFNYMGSKPGKTPLYIIFDSTPENITFAKTAQWNNKPMLGRPEPIFTYENSGATTVTLTGDFFVDSADEHKYKLKVSDYLMSLATPSRDNFMPSPVQIIIGEWKNFRAIVNSVSIDFKGPWAVTSKQRSDADIVKATTAYQNAVAYAAHGDITKESLTSGPNAPGLNLMDAHIAASYGIPSHAPYFFTATLTLTLVSKENEVNYAEDIIKNADKAEYNAIDEKDIAAVSNLLTNTGGSSSTLNSGAFTIGQTTSGYSFKDGMLSANSSYTVAANSSFKPGTGDSDRQSGDLTVITRAVSDVLSNVIKKKIG